MLKQIIGKLEKKIVQKIFWERERNNLFVRENYANNGRENEKFIVKGCE